MEGIWSFSPTSESCLQRFLTIASENQAPESRWLEFFRQRDGKNELTNENSFVDLCISDSVNEDCEVKNCKNFANIIDAEDLAHYSNVIETSLDARFEDIVQECVKEPVLLELFAENLNKSVIEKFLKHAFKQPDLNEKFVQAIFSNLLPAFWNNGSLRVLIEILTKSFTAYKDSFVKVLFPLLLNEDAPEDLLLNIVKNVSEEDRNTLMVRLCCVNISSKQFLKHIQSILELYKDSEQTSETQNYIYNKLVLNSDNCSNNVIFGRLLLSFIQKYSKCDTIDISTISTLTSNHYSVFRRSCESALENLL